MSNLLKIWIGMIVLGGCTIVLHIDELHTETDYDALKIEWTRYQERDKLDKVKALLKAKKNKLEKSFGQTVEKNYDKQMRFDQIIKRDSQQLLVVP